MNSTTASHSHTGRSGSWPDCGSCACDNRGTFHCLSHNPGIDRSGTPSPRPGSAAWAARVSALSTTGSRSHCRHAGSAGGCQDFDDGLSDSPRKYHRYISLLHSNHPELDSPRLSDRGFEQKGQADGIPDAETADHGGMAGIFSPPWSPNPPGSNPKSR